MSRNTRTTFSFLIMDPKANQIPQILIFIEGQYLITIFKYSTKKTHSRAEIAKLVPKFRSGPDRIFHMWPGSEPHRIMIDKIIFIFSVAVVIL